MKATKVSTISNKGVTPKFDPAKDRKQNAEVQEQIAELKELGLYL